MSIIITQNGVSARRIDKAEIAREDYLQQYIHENPDAIPIYELHEDKRLLILKREFATAAGPIDALAVDKDGELYIVETKLYKNPDKRTVVAQALDYGAALWKHFNDFSEFVRVLNKETEQKFGLSLEEKLKEFFGIGDEEVVFLLERLKGNLDSGNIKFVILMDAIDERLKDLILYVNQNSQFDIYAVQLEYYRFEQYEIMIPKLFGVEVKKKITSGALAARGSWDEASFLRQAQELLGAESGKVSQMYRFFKENSESLNWGTGANIGSCSPIFDSRYGGASPITLYTNGKFEAKFRWVLDKNEGQPEKQAALQSIAGRFFSDMDAAGIAVSEGARKYQETFRLQPDELVGNFDAVFAAVRKLPGR